MRVSIRRGRIFSPELGERVRLAASRLPEPVVEGSFEDSLKSEWLPIARDAMASGVLASPSPDADRFGPIWEEVVDAGLGIVGVALDHWIDAGVPFVSAGESPYRFMRWLLAPGPLAGVHGDLCPDPVRELAMLWPSLDAELETLLDPQQSSRRGVDHLGALEGLGEALAVSGARRTLGGPPIPGHRIAAVLQRAGHQADAVGRATRGDARPDGAGPSRGILLGTVCDFMMSVEVVRASRLRRGEPEFLRPHPDGPFILLG